MWFIGKIKIGWRLIEKKERKEFEYIFLEEDK